MSEPLARVLVVDDDRLKRLTLEEQLSRLGYEVVVVDSAFGALRALDDRPDLDIVLTDLKMAGMDGLTLLKKIRAERPAVDVIVMTAYGSIETAVEAIRNGAYDYVQKPFVVEELALKLDHLGERRRAAGEIEHLRSRLTDRYRFHQFVSASKAVREIIERAQAIADADVPVVICGETGTGKEMLAQAIHYSGRRRGQPFVALSCAVLNPNLLEGEIFGFEAGAFTGALRQKKGRLELAGEGTVLLDDVDDIPVDLQAKFLRVFQEGKFERVGGEQSLPLRARVIAATKRDLRQMAREGKFREDLMYRLDVIRLDLPPLRQRREDIPVLLDHFREKHGLSREFSPEVVKILLDHDWPGNVRELENVILQLKVLASTGPIGPAELPKYLWHKHDPSRLYELYLEARSTIDLPTIIHEIEQAAIEWALIKAGGNQSRAAEVLNLPRTSLRRAIQQTEAQTP